MKRYMDYLPMKVHHGKLRLCDGYCFCGGAQVITGAGEDGVNFGAFASAYGGLNNTEPKALDISQIPVQVPLTVKAPSRGLCYTPLNSITAATGGIYEICFLLAAMAGFPTRLTVSVRRNGQDMPETVQTRALNTRAESVFGGTAIVRLCENDIIDMAVRAEAPLIITLISGVSASMNLIKLH